MKRISILLLSLLFISTAALAQESSFEDMMDMSLEELMDIEVYSVSKKSESLFEAPLSSSIITQEQIQRAGITSIPEALRLIPGLIVREVSNGNYDVHLRGFDNLNRYSDASTGGNSITLAMIDGRPVFNNNTGGIFWESLPIDIVDIERIEVVRGPAAALYGPNAVSGVINIITKKAKKDGFSVSALANQGVNTDIDNSTTTGGLRLGYKFNDKLNVTVSGNLQKRQRLSDQYFSYSANDYVVVDSLKGALGQPLTEEQQAYAFPNGNESLEKLGGNIFLDYQPTEWLNLSAQAGYQNASSQRVFRQNPYTPFSVLEMESYYASLQMKAKGLTGRVSFINGEDDLNTLPFFIPDGDSIMLAYTYENVEGYLEYEWEVMDKLTIVPGFSYQRSTYSDNNLDDVPNQRGLLNGRKTIFNLSGSVRADYRPIDNLRLIGAGRFDTFTHPDDVYYSFELASSYKINESNLVRAVFSRSNSGAFMAPTFLDFEETYTIPTPFGPFNGIARFQGNQELALFQLQLIELGYRTRLLSNLELDVELFNQRSQNSNEIVDDEIPAGYFEDISSVQVFRNIPLEATQFGATIGVNYIPSNKLQLRPFVTVQQTKTEGLPTGYNTPERNSVDNIENTREVDNEQTPSVYGGIVVNYAPTEKWNLNLNSYYLDAHTQFNEYDLANRFSTAGSIETNLINNFNVSYKPVKDLAISLNVRNFTNNTNREYYGADSKTAVFMLGLSYGL